MRLLSFVDLERSLAAVPGPVVTQLRRVDIGRGREELFANQLPALLSELAHRARIASITASSALEGVVVENDARAAAIIAGRATVLRSRSEQEFAGYRSAWDYLFTQPWRPLNVGLLLHLHRELFARTAVPGGRFKESDNLVVDRAPDGSIEVRFVPVPAARTEYYTVELVDRYRQAIDSARHHPLLLIGLFVLDLLTIHPFADGNGRVVRALTNALLDDCGYAVGRYVSVEQLIAESADEYYASVAGLDPRLARSAERPVALAVLPGHDVGPGVRPLRAADDHRSLRRHQAGPGPRVCAGARTHHLPDRRRAGGLARGQRPHDPAGPGTAQDREAGQLRRSRSIRGLGADVHRRHWSGKGDCAHAGRPLRRTSLTHLTHQKPRR